MNLVKAIGVGALGLLAVSGIRMLTGMSKQAKLPSKEETLLILEEVRREYYPLLIDIADYVAKELAPRGIPPDNNEQLVLENPPFKQQIETINKKIYAQYSEDDVKEAIETLFKEDGDILKQRHEFREEYKKSLLGIRPEEQMVVSRKLNKAKVLDVVAFLLNSKGGDTQARWRGWRMSSSPAWTSRTSKSSWNWTWRRTSEWGKGQVTQEGDAEEGSGPVRDRCSEDLPLRSGPVQPGRRAVQGQVRAHTLHLA